MTGIIPLWPPGKHNSIISRYREIPVAPPAKKIIFTLSLFLNYSHCILWPWQKLDSALRINPMYTLHLPQKTFPIDSLPASSSSKLGVDPIAHQPKQSSNFHFAACERTYLCSSSSISFCSASISSVSAITKEHSGIVHKNPCPTCCLLLHLQHTIRS